MCAVICPCEIIGNDWATTIIYFCVPEGGWRVALQSNSLWHPAHSGRHDVHRQHPQPLRHQHWQVGFLFFSIPGWTQHDARKASEGDISFSTKIKGILETGNLGIKGEMSRKQSQVVIDLTMSIRENNRDNKGVCLLEITRTDDVLKWQSGKISEKIST